jgi:hypothetical protein
MCYVKDQSKKIMSENPKDCKTAADAVKILG